MGGERKHIRTRPKYPIDKYLGRYQSWLLTLYGSRSFWYNATHLERFFARFPKTTSLDEFTIADVSDYKIWRLREGANVGTVQIELNAVRHFWSWMIEQANLPFTNPAERYKPSTPAVTKRDLKLEDFRRLLSKCDDNRVRNFILGLVQGENRLSGTSWAVIGRGVKRAGLAADLPWITIPALRSAIRSCLWREIIRANYDKLCDTFLPEAKLNSSPLADIEITPADEWSTISYRDEYHSLIGGVQ